MKLKYKNWNDISVSLFNKLITELKSIEIVGDDLIDALNYNVIILSLLCDVSEDEVLALTPQKFKKLVSETDFIHEIPKVEIKDSYIINGKKYNVFRNIGKMNMSQYIDFQTLYEHRDEKFAEMLAVFLIPEGKEYGIGYDIAEVVNEINNHFLIVDGRSIMFFFALSYQALAKTTLTYSIKKMKKKMKMEKNKEKKQELQKMITLLEENGNIFI